MDTECRDLCERLAQRMVANDYAGARELLAPWLHAGTTPEALEAIVAEQSEGLPYPPATWTVDRGFAELADLRKPDPFGPPSRPLPREITDGNFQGWYCIQFAPDASHHEEQNICFDLWVIPVALDQGVRIGYLEGWEAS